MFTHVPTLIGAVDDDGVLGETALVEEGEYATDVVVDRCHAAQVVLRIALVLPAHEILALERDLAEGVVLGAVGTIPLCALLRSQVAWRDELEVVLGQVLGDRHLLLPGRLAAATPVVEQRRRLRDLHVVVQGEVVGTGLPVAVWRLVLEHQEERLVVLARLLQPGQREVREDVGGVALPRNQLPIAAHAGVVVGPLAAQDVPVIEARGLALQVPLADQGRLVARIA